MGLARDGLRVNSEAASIFVCLKRAGGVVSD